MLAKPGTSFQVLLAILIMLCHLLLVLKLAPYHASTEDWTSFISSFTLTLTTLGGFALISDKGSNVPTFDSDGLAIILVALAGSCIAVNIGITIMFDCGVWDRFCGPKDEGGGGGDGTKSRRPSIASFFGQTPQVTARCAIHSHIVNMIDLATVQHAAREKLEARCRQRRV